MVPFSFESAKSGIADRSFHSCVWYGARSSTCRKSGGQERPAEFRRGRLPRDGLGQRESWWRTHEGGHTPFTCDITDGATVEDSVGTSAWWSGRKILRLTATFPAESSIGRKNRPAFFMRAPRASGRQSGWSLSPKVISKRSHHAVDRRVGEFRSRIVEPAPFQFVTVAIEAGGRMLANRHESGRRTARRDRGASAANRSCGRPITRSCMTCVSNCTGRKGSSMEWTAISVSVRSPRRTERCC